VMDDDDDDDDCLICYSLHGCFVDKLRGPLLTLLVKTLPPVLSSTDGCEMPLE